MLRKFASGLVLGVVIGYCAVSIPLQPSPIDGHPPLAEEERTDASLTKADEVAPAAVVAKAEEILPDATIPKAEEIPAEVTLPMAEEIPGDVTIPTAEQIPTEVTTPRAEEISADVSRTKAEEISADVTRTKAEAISADVTRTKAEEVSADVSRTKAEEILPDATVRAEDVPSDAIVPTTEDVPSDASSTKDTDVSLPARKGKGRNPRSSGTRVAVRETPVERAEAATPPLDAGPKPLHKTGKGHDGTALLLVRGASQTLRGGPTIAFASFRIARRPISNAQFRAFVKSGYVPTDDAWKQAAESATDADPVVHVTWIDASAYAAWAGLRLPTEVEWRAAEARRLFDRTPRDCWEWTASWYDRYPNTLHDDRHFGEEYRVILRTSDPTRNFYRPDASNFDVGFRCAADVEGSDV